MNRFLKPGNVVLDGVSQLLPDASQEKSESDRISIEAANAEVKTALNTSKPKHKRGPYNVFSPEVRAKIGRFASQHGNTKAARQFSSELKVPVMKVQLETSNGITLKYCRKLTIQRKLIS